MLRCLVAAGSDGAGSPAMRRRGDGENANDGSIRTGVAGGSNAADARRFDSVGYSSMLYTTESAHFTRGTCAIKSDQDAREASGALRASGSASEWPRPRSCRGWRGRSRRMPARATTVETQRPLRLNGRIPCRAFVALGGPPNDESSGTRPVSVPEPDPKHLKFSAGKERTTAKAFASTHSPTYAKFSLTSVLIWPMGVRSMVVGYGPPRGSSRGSPSES